MPRPHRNHPLWHAFLLHRISGLLLALFLPLHFYVLGLAFEGASALDSFLAITAHPLTKAAECVLVFLLALHFLGGLRLLALEFLPWRDWQKTLAATAACVSFAVACLFLLNAVQP
jgi:fumarate reductase subunit D